MIRAACKTLVGFRPMHESLKDLALLNLPCRQAVGEDRITPLGWDSAAICSNLVNILEGEGLSLSLSSLLS